MAEQDKATFNKTATSEFQDQTTRQNEERILNNYAKLISDQNRILAKVSLSEDENDIHYIDKIRTESNCFIRSILEELTDLYGRLRKVKRQSQEKINTLTEELKNQKEKYQALKDQFYDIWQDKNIKSNDLVAYLNNQLDQCNRELQILAKVKKEQINEKQKEISHLQKESISLKQQIAEKQKIIRKQRDYGNDRSVEMKGMEKLIVQYQESIQTLECKVQIREKQIQQLQKKVQQNQKNLQKVKKELDKRCDLLVQKNTLLSEKQLKITILTDKVTKIKMEKQELQAQYENTAEKNNQLQKKAIEKSEKIQTKEDQAKNLLNQNKILKQKLFKEKEETEKVIRKMEECCKTKEQLLSRLFYGKLNKLRQQHSKMKKDIQKQLLVFLKLTKIDWKTPTRFLL